MSLAGFPVISVVEWAEWPGGEKPLNTLLTEADWGEGIGFLLLGVLRAEEEWREE